MDNNDKIDFLDHFKGQSLVNFFGNFQGRFGNVEDNPEIKEMFLAFMKDLMITGELKLARNGNFLEGTIEEQIDLFRNAWPKEYDENVPEKDIDYMWWWTLSPAGAVWFWEDGTIIWT
ncbi:hypothetical protein EV693_102228 [Nicoletella semolina]|uniref:DUF596 domain-containing protein n=1 Tax=Nicoletella semolina TaxID=271160 RepID=A0A4R2NBX4_9PAST|nr:DUF596 domain-containing protein [Nicoletella semolina]MDH2924999.1 hypothetical protein [Nicoletella semolina]TCP18548.1 hypothetical protein EV693_102228 [Nicoletella semolina]